MKKQKVVVTFATYPARIDAACLVAKNILSEQTLKPDVTIMNVFEGHFPGRKLPEKFSELVDLGLEVHWHKIDMRSYNKFLYTFKKYPDDLVITLDDDIDYPRNLIEHLVEGHKKWPDAVIASAICLMTFNLDGTPKPRHKWPWEEKTFSTNFPSKWLYFGSGSGTLFIPRRIMTDKLDLFNKKKIREDAPTDDEAWLNIARILNDIDVVLYDPLYTVNEQIIDNTERYALHTTVNNKPATLKAHAELMKKYNIRNTELDPLTKLLIYRSEQEDILPDEFLSVARSGKLFLGNIKRGIIRRTLPARKRVPKEKD